jgi:RNA polymerase sigma-70 factor (ECF subfamily)
MNIFYGFDDRILHAVAQSAQDASGESERARTSTGSSRTTAREGVSIMSEDKQVTARAAYSSESSGLALALGGLGRAAAIGGEESAGVRAHGGGAEQSLLARARAGEERALREFYTTYQPQVRGHLHRMLGQDAEVDDLVQTIFGYAFGALHTFKGHSTISTWLYRITANTTHNLLRKRFRIVRIKAAFEMFNTSRGTNVRETKLEARDEAQRILQLLNPGLREVFVLYHYEGLTLHEISEVLQCPISTIGDRLTRARQQLREMVEEA